MTFPRRLAAVSGGVFSQSVAPANEGNLPSSRRRIVESVVLSDPSVTPTNDAIAVPITPTRAATSRSLLAFTLQGSLHWHSRPMMPSESASHRASGHERLNASGKGERSGPSPLRPGGRRARNPRHLWDQPRTFLTWHRGS